MSAPASKFHHVTKLSPTTLSSSSPKTHEGKVDISPPKIIGSPINRWVFGFYSIVCMRNGKSNLLRWLKPKIALQTRCYATCVLVRAPGAGHASSAPQEAGLPSLARPWPGFSLCSATVSEIVCPSWFIWVPLIPRNFLGFFCQVSFAIYLRSLWFLVIYEIQKTSKIIKSLFWYIW